MDRPKPMPSTKSIVPTTLQPPMVGAGKETHPPGRGGVGEVVFLITDIGSKLPAPGPAVEFRLQFSAAMSSGGAPGEHEDVMSVASWAHPNKNDHT